MSKLPLANWILLIVSIIPFTMSLMAWDLNGALGWFVVCTCAISMRYK